MLVDKLRRNRPCQRSWLQHARGHQEHSFDRATLERLQQVLPTMHCQTLFDLNCTSWRSNMDGRFISRQVRNVGRQPTLSQGALQHVVQTYRKRRHTGRGVGEVARLEATSIRTVFSHVRWGLLGPSSNGTPTLWDTLSRLCSETVFFLEYPYKNDFRPGKWCHARLL